MDRPLAVRVCGEALVVWRAGSGEVAAAPDKCPHREAPLSDGQIVEGLLECPYHGWSFDGQGRCALIPSSGPGGPVPSKAHLSRVQVQERYGLVWVALDEPAAPLPDIEVDRDPTYRRIVEPMQEWHCAATRMVDNFLDVAHFPWVHTGTFGAASERVVAPVTLEPIGDFFGWRYEVQAVNDGAGAVASGQTTATVERAMTTGFALPLLVRSTISYPVTGLDHILLLVSTPIDDGHSLFTFIVWRNDDHSVPIDEVIAFDRAIGAADKRLLETVRGTLRLDAVGLVNTQADRASVEWRRRLRLSIESA